MRVEPEYIPGYTLESQYIPECFVKKPVLMFVLLVVACFLSAQETVGVLDISPKQGVSAVEADIVTDFVYDALYRYGSDSYRIISRQSREAILSEHEFSMSGFCDDASCALEVGRYLSADYVVIGSFTKFGSKYYLSLQLVDVNTTEVSGSAREGADDLDGIAANAVDACVAGVFGGRRAATRPTAAAPEPEPEETEPEGPPADLKVGDLYGGGIVFYLDGKGGGLVVAETDQSTGVSWGPMFKEVGGTRADIGAGEANTERIVNVLGSNRGNAYAAKVCYDLVLNGYDDWFLPSKEELRLMNKTLHYPDYIGNFAREVYWSSTENGSVNAEFYDFGSGLNSSHKTTKHYVRAIRSF